MTTIPSPVRQALNNSLLDFQTTYQETIRNAGTKPCAFVAYGSTGLGIQLALHDHGSPHRLLGIHERHPGTIGLTFSGNSTEVITHLADTPGALLITGNTTVRASNKLLLSLRDIPVRYLPLLAYKIAAAFAENEEASAAGTLTEQDPVKDIEALLSALDACYQTRAIPVFCDARPSMLHRIFAAQYMECLKQPALAADFPEYTHDLLWSLHPNNKTLFYFIHLEPFPQLDDNRYTRTLGYIDRMGHRQASFRIKHSLREHNYSALCFVLHTLMKVAAKNGIRSNEELSFS